MLGELTSEECVIGMRCHGGTHTKSRYETPDNAQFAHSESERRAMHITELNRTSQSCILVTALEAVQSLS